MRNDALINWRNTQPNASEFPAHVAAMLDLASDLAGGSLGSFFWFRYSDCDIFDVVRLIEFVQHSGVLTTNAERQEADQVISWLRANQTPYMSDAEVSLRLQHSEGCCPLCGAEITTSSNEPDERGSKHVMCRCQHFLYTHVHDLDAVVRDPKSWSGYRWPYAQFSQDRLSDSEGKQIRYDYKFSGHRCPDCTARGARLHFRVQVQKLLSGWLAEDGPQWTGLGSSPLSGLRCQGCTGSGCRIHCTRMAALADQIVTQEQSEIRLNGAGLKLYTRGVQVSLSHGTVTFSMYVGGDQRHDYECFVEHANTQIDGVGLRDYKCPK